ncbi:MAG: DinB family protein [Flavobacteriales bacterium]
MKTYMESLLQELEQEAIGTRKMLAIVPKDKSDWKPHTKSMSLKDLSVHLADIPGWLSDIIQSDVLDMAVTPYNPSNCNGGDELVAHFDGLVNQAKKDLANNQDALLERTWTMRNGENKIMQMPTYDAIRHSFGQMIHHRAQLGVYLRLLDIPIPGVYGPSADDMQP